MRKLLWRGDAVGEFSAGHLCWEHRWQWVWIWGEEREDRRALRDSGRSRLPQRSKLVTGSVGPENESWKKNCKWKLNSYPSANVPSMPSTACALQRKQYFKKIFYNLSETIFPRTKCSVLFSFILVHVICVLKYQAIFFNGLMWSLFQLFEPLKVHWTYSHVF